MKWEYNKKSPWLSGYNQNNRDTARWVMFKMSPGVGRLYFSVKGKWVSSIADAKVMDSFERGSYAHCRAEGEMFELVHD